MILNAVRTLADSACTGGGFCTNLPVAGASGSNLHALVQIALGIFAAVAVLIIVIAGLNFVYAQGDPQKVTKARNTIIYALIGLGVAVSAELIVTFVLGKF